MVTKLSPYVPGPLHWYAKQDSGPDDWCIAIGKGSACFTMDERARAMSDDFIRELATQILGYQPDSVPDLERRIEEAKERSSLAREQANRYQNEAIRWGSIEADALGKLLSAKAAQAE